MKKETFVSQFFSCLLDIDRTMESLNADELGTLLTLGAAAVGSLLVIIVNCLNNSKCTKIKCCGMECDRVVEPTQTEGEGAEGEAEIHP